MSEPPLKHAAAAAMERQVLEDVSVPVWAGDVYPELENTSNETKPPEAARAQRAQAQAWCKSWLQRDTLGLFQKIKPQGKAGS